MNPVFYTENDFRLYHHGIKGQKWGQRNGPPYPLDASDHSAAEKKAMGEGNKPTNASISLDKLKAKAYRLRYQAARKYGSTELGKKFIDKRDWVGESRFDDGTSRFLDSYDADHQEVEERTLTATGEKVYFPAATVLKELGPQAYGDGGGRKLSEVVKEINPDFGQSGTTQNCSKCTAAMEMAMRGMRVEAGRQIYPAYADACTYWFDGVQAHGASSISEQVEHIKTLPAGARGQIDMQYPNGQGGHAMYFLKTADSVEVFDAQCGRTFGSVRKDGSHLTVEESMAAVANHYGFDPNGPCRSFRFDCATPNYDHMAEDGVLRSPRDVSTQKVRDKRDEHTMWWYT